MAKLPLHVAHVQSNVKGGVDTPLAPKTLIVGPNGAGKSRVVNTVELALSGYASDIVGRPALKKGADLIALAPEGEPLHAQATLSDDRGASYRIERRPGGKTARPEHAKIGDLEVIYPAPMVVAALRGNLTTARSFVLQHSGLDIHHDTIIERLPSTVRESYEEGVAHVTDTDPLDVLLGVRKYADAASKTARALVKAGETGEVPAQVTTEEYETAREAVRTTSAAYLSAREIPDPVDLKALYAQASEALTALQNAERDAQALAKVAQQEVDGSADAAKARGALVTLFTLVADHTDTPREIECVLCGQAAHVDPADYRRRAQVLADHNGQAQAVMAAKASLPQALEQLKQLQATAEAAVHRYRTAHATYTADTPVDRNTEVRRAYAAVTSAETRLRELERVRGAHERHQADQERAKEAQRAVTLYTDLSAACADLVDQLVSEGREGFIIKVQQYLPSSDTFDLVLKVHRRDVCLFGFRRDGELHTALSGAEWARLTMALGAACIPAKDNVLAILTPEERAYDGVTLAAIMRALSDTPAQVILTSPIKPRGRKPAGWMVIEAGGGEG